MLSFALRFHRIFNLGGATGASLAGAALLSLCVLASAPASAQAVVQPLPNPAADRLADALQTLSRQPQSLEALIAAGDASLTLGDAEAAHGFFARAEALAPADGRIKAGLATLELRRDRPVAAVQLFEEAERLGAPGTLYAGERGLAYDLVGDNARAQFAYATALSQGGNPEVVRRLAVSQAISGQRRASETTLLPQLQRQDRAGFRARAFALAILGQADEAVSIAQTMLPPRLSSRVSPYLRYMPRLTRAQQAAAAHLGRFPRATEIGRDEPGIAALSAAAGSGGSVQGAQGADARLEPRGAPLGGAVAQPAPAPTPQPDLSAAFADLAVAAPPPTAAPGAVDITAFEPRREAPPRRAAPSPPAHPSRHWVQVATGRDIGALAFDWRRIRRTARGLLDQAEPYVAPWNQNTRLLAGPFATPGEAQELVTALTAVGVPSFRHTSAAGEEVRRID